MSNRAEEEAKLIYIGATITQLSVAFRLSQNVVKQRLLGHVAGSRPKGASENDPPRYHIRDAAPYLCEPKVDIEEILKTISPSKVPPALSDVFWKGQKTRLEVMEKQGDLWSTERVVKILGEAFKPCRMAIMMFKEHVEQQEELSPSARSLLDGLSDDLLASLHQGLVETFADYVAQEDDHGMPLDRPPLLTLPAREEEEPFDDGFDD